MNKFIVISLLAIFSYCSLHAQVKFYDKGSYRVNLDYNYNSSSSYYDFQGKEILYQKDTFNIFLQDTIPYQYNLKQTYELSEYILTPGVEYSLEDNLIVYLNLPLFWSTLVNTYEIDTNRYSPTYGTQMIKGDYSAFTPLYYEIGGLFRLNKGLFSTTLKLGTQLPPSLKNGYLIDTTNSMYIYNAYKFYGGILSTLTMEKGFLELETTYKLRTGDFNDIFLIRIEGGFTSVPNTALKGIFIYNLNMGDYDMSKPVNPRYTTLQESSIDVGAAFEATISKKVIIDFSYLITLGLENTLKYGHLRLKTSVLIN